MVIQSKIIDLGVNGKPICDFLLVINCNLEFLDETYAAKTRGMGLAYDENFIIISSNVFV